MSRKRIDNVMAEVITKNNKQQVTRYSKHNKIRKTKDWSTRINGIVPQEDLLSKTNVIYFKIILILYMWITV